MQEVAIKQHAKLSASSAHRWLNCIASVNMESIFKDENITSYYAEEGTTAHELAELALKNETFCSNYIGEKLNNIEVTEEMAEFVQEYVDYVRNLGGKHFTEVQVKFEEYVKDGFGTCDSINVVDDILYITDLKYGQGVLVEAYKNEQLMLYALGALETSRRIKKQCTQVVMTIVQPRKFSISTYSCTIEELQEFGNYVKVRAIEAEKGGTATPSHKACKFCKAKGVCKAYATACVELVASEFKNLEIIKMKDINKLSNSEIAELLKNVSFIKNWCDSIETTATTKLNHGEKIDGFKLVEGRSLRKWSKSDSDVIAILEENGFSKQQVVVEKLQTLAQLEKTLKLAKEPWFSDLIEKPIGKPTLALESDKRKAINVDLSEFNQ